MTSFKIIGAACALAVLSAGAASAAPMAHQDLGTSATAVSMTGSTMMGKKKQRQRTHTTRCNNMPSRC